MQPIERKFRHSLSTKLIVGILLLAMPIYVVSIGFLFFQTRSYIKQEATEHAISKLNTASHRIDRYLRIVKTATDITDWLAEEHFTPDSLLAYSRRIIELNKNIDGCSISAEPDMFPQYGRYFSAYTIRKNDSVITVIEKPYEYFTKQWYTMPKNLKGSGWVVCYDNEDTLDVVLDGMLATYCKPLYTADSLLLGVVSTDLSLKRVSKAISADKPFPNSYYVMVDRYGRYFIHPDSTRLFTSTIFSGADPNSQSDLIALGHEMTSGKEGSMSVNVNGKPYIVCFKPLTNARWSLALISPESDILQGYQRLTNIIIPLLILGLILILLLGRKSVVHAISPLNLLVEQSQRMAAGHYDQQIEQSKRRDAVGQLQNSFKLMQASLNRQMSKIEKANDEIIQRNEELARANQLAEEAGRQKTIFIHNMTHQIRTPMNIVMGFAQVMEGNFDQFPQEETKKLAELMNTDAKKLRRMVQMLFDSSEMGTSEELKNKQSEDFSCNEAARNSINDTIKRFPSLQIEFDTALPDSICIHGNRLFLMHSLREVLYNSAKYSDGKHIAMRVSETDEYVQFVIDDTGTGIPQEHRDKIFEPFQKIDELSEGLGLGLPLTLRHVTLLGGTLTLDNDYSDGCRFIIQLPKAGLTTPES